MTRLPDILAVRDVDRNRIDPAHQVHACLVDAGSGIALDVLALDIFHSEVEGESTGIVEGCHSDEYRNPTFDAGGGDGTV